MPSRRSAVKLALFAVLPVLVLGLDVLMFRLTLWRPLMWACTALLLPISSWVLVCWHLLTKSTVTRRRNDELPRNGHGQVDVTIAKSSIAFSVVIVGLVSWWLLSDVERATFMIINSSQHYVVNASLERSKWSTKMVTIPPNSDLETELYCTKNDMVKFYGRINGVNRSALQAIEYDERLLPVYTITIQQDGSIDSSWGIHERSPRAR